MKIIANLITSFMIIGLSACGGGLVTIPLIQHEMVNIRHWLTLSDVTKLLAIAQMTPGPIAINAATFVGFQVAGVIGSLMSTLAVIFPSIAILFFSEKEKMLSLFFLTKKTKKKTIKKQKNKI